MTDHSIEELRRQYEAASSRAAEADMAKANAKARYDAARCAQKIAEFEALGGVIGVTRVRVPATGWRGVAGPDLTRGPFFVIGAEILYGPARFTLAKIKKDGTASASGVGATPENVIILPEDQS